MGIIFMEYCKKGCLLDVLSYIPGHKLLEQ